MFSLWLARAWMRINGYVVVGDGRAYAKYVLIAAPHTSNWDFPYTLATARILGMKIHWIGKHTLFRWPFGGIMRALGGVGINRSSPQNLVAQMVDRFAHSDQFALVVPPEGTRTSVKYWKSGFYQIAKAANVPIAMAFVDYAKKRAGIGGYVVPSGDVRADMDRIRAFYADIGGKYPEHVSVPRLKEEDAAGS